MRKELINTISEEYLNGKSIYKIAMSVGVSETCITYNLKKNNVQIRKVPKYQFDNRYFECINTEDKAYWLGFITADGGIVQDSLSIILNSKDERHLYKLKDALNSTHLIKPCPTKVGNKIYDRRRFYIRSRPLTSDLERYGVVERKSFSCYIPFSLIPKTYLRHYVRGVFDGDGSIMYKIKRNTRAVDIVGNNRFIEEIQSVFISELGLPKNKIRKLTNCSGISVMSYRGNLQIDKIYEFFYNEANTFLERKKLLFDEYKIRVEENRRKGQWKNRK